MFKKFLLGLALLFIFSSFAFSVSISNSVTYNGALDTTKVSKGGDTMTGSLIVSTNCSFGQGTKIGNSSQYWENQVLDLGIFGKYPTLTPFSIGSSLGNYGGFPGALIISGTPELPDPSILLLKVGVGSVQMMYNWDDYAGHSLLVDGGSMIMRNGRSVFFFDQVSSDSIRLSQDSITKSNLVIDFYNKDTWSTAGNVQILGGLIGLSNLEVNGTISSLGTITVTAPINTTGGFYPDQSGDLPVSGYTEGAIYYSTTTHKMYVSTEAVTGTYSWKEMW
jgi:hypothetical protein